MTNSILQRTAGWLCLAVALLTGFSPAQGFVICLEPDGRVTIEIAASVEVCGCCENYREGAAPTKAAVHATEVSDCPCVDLPVPGSSQDRDIQRKPIELRLGSWIANPLSLYAGPILSAPLAVRTPPLDAPRPAESLALIRSVVLLV